LKRLGGKVNECYTKYKQKEDFFLIFYFYRFKKCFSNKCQESQARKNVTKTTDKKAKKMLVLQKLRNMTVWITE